MKAVLVIPVLYIIFERLAEFVRKLFGTRPQPEIDMTTPLTDITTPLTIVD